MKQHYQHMPQELANALASEAQKAVEWFHDNSKILTAIYTDRPISDEEVELRIQGFQYAMDREVARMNNFEYEGGWEWRWDDGWRELHKAWVAKWEEHKASAKLVGNWHPEHNKPDRYPLDKLPFTIQRALVTRWEALWDEWADRYDPNAPVEEVSAQPVSNADYAAWIAAMYGRGNHRN